MLTISANLLGNADAEHHNGAHATENGHDEHAKKPFNAGKMILDHVIDSHGWHLFADYAIHLPVIVKTDKGIEVFSSKHLGHHGEQTYAGKNYNYKLITGNVVAVNAQGEALESAGSIDFSITKNVAAIFITMLLMSFMFISIANKYKNNKGKAPKGLQSFMEPLILFVRDEVAIPNIGKKKYAAFMPFLLTAFFFILLSNYMGLIPFFPGGANVTGSISVAAALAIIVFIITVVKGNGHFWRHIFAMPGVPIPVLIILTPIEIIGLFLRPFVLMIRLFANIAAGHIIVLAFFSLIFIFGEMHVGAGYGVSIMSLMFTIFMGALELLVAFLQAYVFTLLTAIYIGASVEEAH